MQNQRAFLHAQIFYSDRLYSERRQPLGLARGGGDSGAPLQEAARHALARVAATQNHDVHRIAFPFEAQTPQNLRIAKKSEQTLRQKNIQT